MKKPHETRSTPELIESLQHCKRAKYVFFWGHKQRSPSAIDQSCLSQWYDSGFDQGGEHYLTAEHFMMAEKARLFGDEPAEKRVLAAQSPGEAKAIGREVKYFDQRTWNENRFQIAVAGNLGKFSASPELERYLLNTGNRVLVEASPVDKIWGIGLDVATARDVSPSDWQGLSLLGFALMEVRKRLSDSRAQRAINSVEGE